MACVEFSGGSRSLFRSQPPAARPSTSAPAMSMPAAPPAHASGGGGGFLSNMAGAVTSGIGHGIGFSVAGRAVDAVLGPRKMEMTHTNEPAPAAALPQQTDPTNAWAAPIKTDAFDRTKQCQLQMEDLQQVRFSFFAFLCELLPLYTAVAFQCLSRYSDLSACQRYFDALKACQQEA